MELRRMLYFVTVAEELSFSRAAERLFIAQPGLSQQIRRLEKELGVELLKRTTRTIELTDAGRAFLPDAKGVIDAVAAATANVQRAVGGETGTLRVGFVSSSALTMVPRVVATMKKKWPSVTIMLTELTTERQLAALLRGELDIGLVREMVETDDLVSTPLQEERFFVALPNSHALADRERVSFADLVHDSFVVFPRDAAPKLFDHIDKLCTQAGFRLRIAQEALQFSTILGLVASGAGIAIVPESLLSLRLDGLAYIPVEDEGARSILSVTCRATALETVLVKNAFTAATELSSIDQ